MLIRSFKFETVNMSNTIAENLSHTFDLNPPFFEDSRKITTKVTRMNREFTYKMDMPPCGIGLDLMVRHLHEFTGRVQALDIPANHGIARFALFRNSLQESRSTAPMAGWITVVGEMDFPMTQEEFEIHGRAWIARAATSTERDEQVLFMRTVKKEPTITVEQFESNILLTNALTNWLPGDTPILTDNEIKHTFFNGMPVTWREKYRAANMNPSTDTFTNILSYMRTCEGIGQQV